MENKMTYKEITKDLEKQIKQYVKNRTAIIGISGGIDSAVVATLAKNVLGKEKVYGILMPYGNQDTKDAKTLVDFLNINSNEINIKNILDKYDFLKIDRLEKGNIMARTRMTILYTFANKLEGLVIGTGNKTEIEIGYFTKYGDGGVDLEPIGDLYKTEIFKLAKFLKIPRVIIEKKPSAELWENQTDENEIGATYPEIDSVLKGEIKKGEIFEKIQRLRNNSAHKRKMPEIIQVRGKYGI
jgi:NAD+ synthase